MNTDKLSPFEYISEQVKIFVVNRLAQSQSTTQQLADAFALLVDDLCISEKSLNYVLDALYKQKIVTFDYSSGVRFYRLLKFIGDNIFELNLEMAERLIVEEDVPFYENKEPTLEDDFYFETINGKICVQINSPIFVEELEDENITNASTIDEQEPQNDAEIAFSEEDYEDSEDDIEASNIITISEDNPNIEVTDNSDNNEENSKDLSEKNAFVDEISEPSTTQIDSEVKNEKLGNQYFDAQEYTQEPFNDEPIESEAAADESLSEEYSFDNENKNVVDNSENKAQEEAINDAFIELKSEEKLVTKEEDNFYSETQVSPISADEYSNSNTEEAQEVNQSSYFAMGNTSESDDLIMSVFGKHLFEASNKQKENNAEISIEKTVEESIKEPTKEQPEPIVIANDEKKNDITERKDQPINSALNAEDNASTNKGINTDDIVFNSDYVYEVPPISSEEEQQRIENALKKLSEYSQKSTAIPKKEQVANKQPEVVENIEPEIPPISLEEERQKREEEQQRIENALKKLSEYSQKPAQKQESVIQQQPEIVENIEPEPQIVEEVKPQKNTLSVVKYIEEQEVINSYDWERKLTRCFVDCHVEEEDENGSTQDSVIVSTYAELKDIMEKKNYKFKPYSNYESVSFYSDNYIFSNRLAKDTSIYTYLFMLLEILIGYFFVDKFVHKGIVSYIVIAICLLVIPIIFILKYFAFKDKRKPANFYFSISIVTAMMIYVNLMVMVVLLAFFIPSLNVSVTNLSSMITTVFYPAGLFLAIPFSVCVYSILYHSKKYHLH